MSANVLSGSTYVITNVKAGTAVDLSAGDNRTSLSNFPLNRGALIYFFDSYWMDPTWRIQPKGEYAEQRRISRIVT